MKRFGFILLILICAQVHGATIVLNLLDNPGTALNAKVIIKAQSNVSGSGTNTYVGATTTLTPTDGLLSFNLVAGRYSVSIGANAAQFINVPTGTATYQFNDLATVPTLTFLPNTGKVYVDSDDATAQYLSDKLAAGSNITLTKLTNSGVKSVSIASSASSGITSLNALTGATQTFATGTSGTDLTVSSSGTVHTINLQPKVNRTSDTMSGTLAVTGALTNSTLTASRIVVSGADKTLASGSATTTEASYLSGVTSALQGQIDGKQPLDSDLTSIAALTTTAFGRGLLDDADAPAGRTSLGVVIGTDVQAYDSDLASIAALSTTSFGRGLLDDADAAAGRTSLGVAIGTDVQAYDADLDDLADGSLTGSKVGTGISASNVTTGTLPDGVIPSGITRDSEWDTIAEIETATGVNIIVATEIDTLAELNALIGDADVPNANTVVLKAGDTMTGTLTVTGMTNSALTASRAMVSAADKSVTSSATTATELGYVSGVTSALQTQIDAKVSATVGSLINATTPTQYDLLQASSTTTTNAQPSTIVANGSSLKLGHDAASPTAQTIIASGPRGGTDSNTTGANATFAGSPGTGTGDGGNLIFGKSVVGSTGSATNATVTALTIATDAQIAATPAVTFAGRVRFPDGTAALPSGVFTSDDDASGTGFYRAAADNFSIASAGVGRLAVVSNGIRVVGNVGFSTSATASADTILSRENAAIIQQGTDGSTATAQTLKSADGSGTDKAGFDFTFAAGQPTGTATPGKLKGQVAPTGTASASTNQPYTTAFTLGGTLKVDTTTTGNVGAGEDTLITYTIPAAQLGSNGDYLEFRVWGTCAANANTKDIKVYYGGTVISDGGVTVLNGVSWRCEGIIVRVTATTQTANSMLNAGAAVIALPTTTSPAETLSGTVVFKVTGTSAISPADNDIVQNGMVLKYNQGL